MRFKKIDYALEKNRLCKEKWVMRFNKIVYALEKKKKNYADFGENCLKKKLGWKKNILCFGKKKNLCGNWLNLKNDLCYYNKINNAMI